ncbi:hypothetical protein FRACYDRAFT_263698 [Fragilariopsis cylindrus CCMP1102]|uniref:BZIP domain-containing protein n=1 Tax=Fragilariopsis cylindrus CCMP1102 TaxID=635003 RepID=A0A1E7EY16_9STRA|nr:hypothetical protein FRACYDRAFT_263698 [Fragilariopsis cylindrus CCMP1102]|eukprot:OEU10757.1 hypothetical protein FRACYDRAFT_263698 [Fragilariopsis cylindrus CCMP1102]
MRIRTLTKAIANSQELAVDGPGEATELEFEERRRGKNRTGEKNRRDRKRLLKQKLEEEIIDSGTKNNNESNKIVEDSASQDEIVLRTSQGGPKTTGLDDEEYRH